MTLLSLPNEILLQIAERVELLQKDLSALHQTNHRLRILLTDTLYEFNVTQHGGSGLLWAATHSHKKAAQKFLAKGADVNTSDEKARTPLYLAAEAGHEDLVRLFLGNGADACLADRRDFTPLLQAAKGGYEPIVDLLLAAGSRCNFSHSYTPGIVDKVVAAGHEAIARKLIESWGGVETRDFLGDTLLIITIRNRAEDLTRLLIDMGADINARGNNGRSPLHVAVWTSGSHKTFVPMLIDLGADLDARAVDGRTPLDYAIGAEELVAKELVEAGACIDYRNDSGVTLLMRAARHGYVTVCRMLLDRGLDVNVQDEFNGWTALFWAMIKSEEKCVNLLLDVEGLDLGLRDKWGMTALLWAETMRQKAMRDCSELFYAVERGDWDTARAEFDRGADMEPKGRVGRIAESLRRRCAGMDHLGPSRNFRGN
ncbi:hypothetical protein AJ79_05810 [Helicocarpus griseus UAMH5409]|uniref:Uncharacterized protein n=1 Tax=Helicocarpus griseus UAMH5409 TaxID=1447875 RepID=A0A2B7XJA7_9EURO|nr:hypothetical protein AJ79_05810 [Helicocarpus griseus UAMH5409]